MSIKRKMFLMFTGMISIVLLFSYTFIYTLFQKSSKEEIMNYQKSMITINQVLMNNFLDSIRQTTLQIIGDEAIGKYLSQTDIEDPIVRLNTRSSIIKQFSHYSTTQILQSTYGYKNTLFLNNKLPIASSFETFSLIDNPYAQTCNIFSDNAILESDWYQKLLLDKGSTYVFINEPKQEFCFAQIIQNNYYTGKYFPEGLGVMIVSLPLSQIEKSFSFSSVSQNSGYALLSNSGVILYQSDSSLDSNLFLETSKKDVTFTTDESTLLRLNQERYITNAINLNYGLELIFLTPYSDIQNSVANLMHKYILFVLFITLVTLFLIYYISGRITKPIIYFSEIIDRIDDTRTFTTSDLNLSNDKELKILYSNFESLLKRNNELIADIEKQNEQEKRSQLKALQAQINPHFIYNTMDVVNWIALSRNEDDIANIVSSIASMMRYSITNPDNLVSVEAELENIREYISLYALRHPNKIHLHIDTPNDLKTIQIPKFTLQPLVENSIRHGMKCEVPNFDIYIRCFNEGSLQIIEVMDDGTDVDATSLNNFLDYKNTTLKVSSGFGIRNVNERIKLKFGSTSRLYYASSNEGHLIARIVLDLGNEILMDI